MRHKSCGALLVLLCTFIPSLLRGEEGTRRIIEYTGSPVPVYLDVGRPVEVEMPEDVVDIVTALSPDQVAVDLKGKLLFVQALREIEGELFVITASSASYILGLSTNGAGSPRDISLRVVPGGEEIRRKLEAIQGLTSIGLVRAMKRKEVPPGVEYTRASGREVYNDGTLSMHIMEAYIAPTMRGYVLLAENLTGVSIPVPVENLAMPGLLAAGADQYILYPQPRTVEEKLAAAYRCRVYVVVK